MLSSNDVLFRVTYNDERREIPRKIESFLIISKSVFEKLKRLSFSTNETGEPFEPWDGQITEERDFDDISTQIELYFTKLK